MAGNENEEKRYVGFVLKCNFYGKHGRELLLPREDREDLRQIPNQDDFIEGEVADDQLQHPEEH